jgi:hypothetical protein
MWVGLSELRELKVSAIGRELGTVEDAFFDPEERQGAYLAVDARGRWPGCVLLVPFELVAPPDFTRGVVPLELEERRIRSAPSIRQDPPLAPEMAERAAAVVVWQRMAWGGFVGTASGGPRTGQHLETPMRPSGAGLRSARALDSYRVKLRDGGLGRVRDLLFGDGWQLRGLVIETGDWLLAERVIVAAKSIESLSFASETVRLNLSRTEIGRAPAFRGLPPDREFIERRLRIAEAFP